MYNFVPRRGPGPRPPVRGPVGRGHGQRPIPARHCGRRQAQGCVRAVPGGPRSARAAPHAAKAQIAMGHLRAGGQHQIPSPLEKSRACPQGRGRWPRPAWQDTARRRAPGCAAPEDEPPRLPRPRGWRAQPSGSPPRSHCGTGSLQMQSLASCGTARPWTQSLQRAWPIAWKKSTRPPRPFPGPHPRPPPASSDAREARPRQRRSLRAGSVRWLHPCAQGSRVRPRASGQRGRGHMAPGEGRGSRTLARPWATACQTQMLRAAQRAPPRPATR
mmetsp:Transcript_12896/g.38934  ORF Transcript_12896/g.38934 Transcript_12896/m.38934 type:complete len:273 (+) Transcript_12896:22-840(+)